MFKSVKELDTAMFEILSMIINKDTFDLASLSYSSDDLNDALAHCVRYGYVTGIRCQETASGKPVFDLKEHITVTREGLLFMEQFKA